MTLETRHLTILHRKQQETLRSVVQADAASLWPTLDFNNLDSTFPALLTAAAPVVSRRRQTSAGLAAIYLRAFRRASEVPGTATVVRPTLTADDLRATLLATSVIPLKNATSNGVPEAQARANGLTLLAGALVRLALNGGRETVAMSVQADPEATGYARVLSGSGCDFCQSLADEPLHTSTAFAAHGNCACTAEPVYGS